MSPRQIVVKSLVTASVFAIFKTLASPVVAQLTLSTAAKVDKLLVKLFSMDSIISQHL